MWRTSRRLLLALGVMLAAACTPASNDPSWAEPAPPPAQQPATRAPTATATVTLVPTQAPSPTPQPTPAPPPEVVASYPINGDRAMSAERPVVLVFDRAMDEPSVAAALALSPEAAVQLTWTAPTRLELLPQEPWQPETDYTITLGVGAASGDGASLAQPYTLAFAVGGRGAPVPALMYHHLAELGQDATPGQLDWTVSPQALAEQLTYLHAHGWHAIVPNDLAAYMAAGEPLPPRSLLITIDDGYKEVLAVAPLFVESGLMPVLFIVTDYVEYGAYLTWEELAGLAAQGFIIGSHSVDHRDPREADDTELRRQMADSKSLLEEQLGVQVDAFCYPYGGVNKRVKEAVATNGYRTGFSLNPTIYQAPDDPLFLGRSRVDYRMSLDDFVALLPD